MSINARQNPTALAYRWSMIFSEKPISTFRDHDLANSGEVLKTRRLLEAS